MSQLKYVDEHFQQSVFATNWDNANRSAGLSEYPLDLVKGNADDKNTSNKQWRSGREQGNQILIPKMH